MPKKCSDCGQRPVSKEQRTMGGSLCEPCSDFATWQNQHDDDCHDEISNGQELLISEAVIQEIRLAMQNCPVCLKEGRTKPKNTTPKSYTSHAECAHPRTPKDREQCRRARRKGES